MGPGMERTTTTAEQIEVPPSGPAGRLADALAAALGRWAPGVGRARRWELAPDATVSLRPGRRGLLLRCERGLLLVTQEGDPEDHVLSQGEEHRAAHGLDAAGIARSLEDFLGAG